MADALKTLLNECVDRFNRPSFIPDDPISIPRRFSRLQDIEIIGFWTAMLAWGQRPVILKSAEELLRLMEGQPYEFVLHHREEDRARFQHFKHRTFQYTDTLYFLEFLQRFYKENESLESAFTRHLPGDAPHTGPALSGFHRFFFSLPDAPARTVKHVATPDRGSTCKRLNMFLRWMVRSDDRGVDIGRWAAISPAQLLMPLDVHVDRVARRLGLITRKQSDWLAVVELTENLKRFDPEDPVKYDFALFGLGVLEKSKSVISGQYRLTTDN